MLSKLIHQLLEDGVKPIIIDTGYDPPLTDVYGDVDIIRDDVEPRNISRWWNRGLDAAHAVQSFIDEEYVVAILNDDLVLPPGFVSRLASAIMRHDAAAAYPNQHGWQRDGDFVHRIAAPISLYRRMTGYAFALRGSKQIRADETLQWWYGDDDIDWKARQRGGSVLVGDLTVQHLLPNSTTVGELATQAGLDRGRFEAIWGRTPW